MEAYNLKVAVIPDSDVCFNDTKIVLEDFGEVDITLEDVVYAVLKDEESDRTIVKEYKFEDDVIMRETLTDTFTPAVSSVMKDKLCVALLSEIPGEETRLLVADEKNGVFRSSDVVKGIFVYDDILMYGIDEEKIAAVNLK